nr:hypothetical protein CFP56_65280 [Quercus suber]
MINPRQSVSFGTLQGRDTTILAPEKKLVPISKEVSNFQMDKVVKITEIASNSNSEDVILVQNHDKPNYFLPSDIVASHLDTNLNCDDKDYYPSCPVSEIEASNFENSIEKLPKIYEDIEMEFSSEVPIESLELKTSSLRKWKRVSRNKAKLNSNDSLVSMPLPSKRSTGASISIKDLDLNHR